MRFYYHQSAKYPFQGLFMMTLLWKKPYSIIERLHLICALALLQLVS